MKIELQEKLVKKYPIIFEDYGGEVSKTGMAFGIQCGDGWYFIIDMLCLTIKRICEKSNIKVKAFQIKEKFGRLCFYIQSDNIDTNICPEIYAVIEFASSLSSQVCEVCGSTKDVIQTGHWIMTRCSECLSKQP